ncbi:MAG: YiiX/YebB-like N1pC/P60 family cysteine hydrolase [Burkholderiaceae bacterium]
MAEPLTKQQIQRLPVVAYEALREQLRTGDLVFCSGSYLFSHAIQTLTHSVWSHVGIIYRDDALQRMFVLESETGIGVRLAPVSKYLRDYHGRRQPYRGQIVVARVQPDVDRQRVHQAISFGMDELTKPYDNSEILRILVRIVFRVSRRTRDRKYICSELVYECFRQAGVSFKLADRFVSPDDIWRDPQVVPLQRIL